MAGRFPWAGSSDSSHKSASDKKTYERAHEKAYDKTAGKGNKKESLLSRSRLSSGSHADRKHDYNPNNCNCGGVHY